MNRVTPELRHLRVSLGAQISYRKAAALLRMFLPPMNGASIALSSFYDGVDIHMMIAEADSSRSTQLEQVRERLAELWSYLIANQPRHTEPAERMVVGIDDAFIKAGHTLTGQRHQFEILTGRVETSQRVGEAFAVVRDLDPYAKRRVQAILRRCPP